MKYEIQFSDDGQYFFHLRSRNGNILVTSETYKTKQSCQKGIKAIKKSLFTPILDKTVLGSV